MTLFALYCVVVCVVFGMRRMFKIGFQHVKVGEPIESVVAYVGSTISSVCWLARWDHRSDILPTLDQEIRDVCDARFRVAVRAYVRTSCLLLCT